MTDASEKTVSEYMEATLSGLKLLRSKRVRAKFPNMSEQFESDLEETIRANPYQPARDGGNSYKDEEEEGGPATPPGARQLRTESGRTSITAGAALEVLNPMRTRYSLPPLKVKRRK